MTDDNLPDRNPFDGLPEEFRRMFEQLAGPGGPFEGGLPIEQIEQLLGGLGGAGGLGALGDLGGLDLGALGGMFGLGGAGGPGPSAQAPEGPVDWRLARRAALQRAGDGDRSPTDEERARHEEALRIAEHWLDGSSLPAPPDAGRLSVASRHDWIDAALAAMRPLVEPVAAAATATMADLARQQLEELGGAEGLDELGLGPLAGMVRQFDPGALFGPLGATLAGLQAGQVLGELARQLVTGHELGLPTGPRSMAFVVVPNVEETFAGYDLDPTEVAVALALLEAAHRRLFHAVPWLEGHVHELVATFAEGTEADADQLRRMAEELLGGVDLEDPEAMERAMQGAADLRMEPTAAQRRTLDRLQGVTALVGAWTRREVARVAAERLPGLGRVEEVLRRRRAGRAEGNQLLATLLGLDLTPDDPRLGEDFVTDVETALGPEGLRRAIAHPENLPDVTELADPARWLARIASSDDVPDDVAALFADLGDAPREASADERLAGAAPTSADTPDDVPDGSEGSDAPDDGTPDDDASQPDG
jgi:putative hydrolase